MIQFVEDLENYHPKNTYSEFVQLYFQEIIKNGVSKYISNLDVEVKILEINNQLIPISFWNTNDHNCYTSSIIWTLNYASEELKKENNKFKRFLFNFSLNIIKKLLRHLNIDNNLYIWNLLLSTNILPELSEKEIKEIKNFLQIKYPKKCLIFRSVNNKITINLKDNLEKNNFSKIVSRQIFFFQKDDLLKINKIKDNIWDKKLFQKHKLNFNKFSKDTSDYYIEGIKKCYDELYINKYSRLNPNFSLDFYKNILNNKFFHINWLFYEKKLLAVYWYYEINKIATTPIFWYILEKNKDFSLYRQITNKTIFETLEKNNILNHSSWAWMFKINRWAIFDLEYMYFLVEWWGIRQKLWWYILEKVSKFIVEPNFKNNIY